MDAAFQVLLSAVERQKALTPKTHEYLDRLFALNSPDVVERLTAVHYAEQSKQVNIRFQENDWPFIEIVQCGDVQFGHKDCRVKSLAQYVEWILSEPWRFCVFTGDMVDAAHALTPGTSFDNLFDAQSQLYRFCEIFAPARHRILGYVGGNHERRQVPFFGDLGILCATMLKIPYSNGRQYINVNFGKHEPFRIMLWHGHPRARTKGALGQIMERFMRQGNAQLYLTGHNHQGLVHPQFREIDLVGEIRVEKFMGAACTSFLETYGTYAEWMGFDVQDVFMNRARIYPGGGNDWELIVR